MCMNEIFKRRDSLLLSIVTMVSFIMFQVQGESGRARTVAELLVFWDVKCVHPLAIQAPVDIALLQQGDWF